MSCFGSGYKMAENFDHSFEEEKIGRLLNEKIARTARRQLDGRHLYLENIILQY